MECQELLPSEGALPPEQTGAETHVVLPTEASEDVAVEPPDPTTDVDGVYSDKNHSELPVNRYSSETNFVVTDNSGRARLRRALSTHRFQVVIVSFVIIDCMVVIAELLMDLRLLSMDEPHKPVSRLTSQLPAESRYLIPDVLHSINIAILSLFILELSVKMVAFGLAFLRLGWEIFDTVVVIVTFTLDVLMQHSHSSTNGLGLFIILRLWRVARILNGMVRSVKMQAHRHMECEKRRRQNLEDELFKYRGICERQRDFIIQLETLLKSNGIPVPSPLART